MVNTYKVNLVLSLFRKIYTFYKMFQILAIDAFRPLGLISIALKNLSKIWSSELDYIVSSFITFTKHSKKFFIKFETHAKCKKCWNPR